MNQTLLNGILDGDRVLLSKAITLIESRKSSDREQAYQLVNAVLPYSGNSMRIGITGSPGVGKSTFIDSFGDFLTKLGYKVAVLAIDPSSNISGGSILGDKTRMERLAANANAFVRPSPTSGELGGVGQRTYEAMLLCEAAGYDIVLIETVGVGQSEIAVREIVDMVLFLTIAGSGDELQGIKRGIMETVDLVVVNKADLFEKRKIAELKENLKYALHLFPEKQSQQKTNVIAVSAIEDTGLKQVWESIEGYFKGIKENLFYIENRKVQKVSWMKKTLHSLILDSLLQTSGFKSSFEKFEQEVLLDKISPTEAALKIFNEISPKD